MTLAADAILRAQTERDFQQQVIDLARLCGFMVYHTYDSRRSPSGFPDLCLLRPPRLIFAELKRERGTPTPEQLEWLYELREVTGVEVYLWVPSMWDEIVEALER